MVYITTDTSYIGKESNTLQIRNSESDDLR